MKSKFGGLNNFLSGTPLTPRGGYKQTADRLDQARERSNSSRRREDVKKRTYEDSYEERQPTRRYEVENEEDHHYHRDYKNTSSSGIRRVNSRENIVYSSSPRVDSDKYRFVPSKKSLLDTDTRSSYNRKMTESQYANFQHVHQQTKHCVEALLKKTGNSIHNLNQTINEFKEKLRRIVEQQYNKLQTVIMNVVENVFRMEMDNIKKMAKIQEKKISKNIGEVREQLEHIYGNLNKVREGIDGPHWKRYAGDFFKDDMESQVEELVGKSARLQVNRTVYLNYDSQKQEDFKQALQRLLQVQLTTSSDHQR